MRRHFGSRFANRRPLMRLLRPRSPAVYASIGDRQKVNRQAAIDACRAALNNACGEINEAARLSDQIFTADELEIIRRELARLLNTIDLKVLDRLAPRPR